MSGQEIIQKRTKINMPLVIGNLVIEKPVIQGGMGVGISLSSLAGAELFQPHRLDLETRILSPISWRRI